MKCKDCKKKQSDNWHDQNHCYLCDRNICSTCTKCRNMKFPVPLNDIYICKRCFSKIKKMYKENPIRKGGLYRYWVHFEIAPENMERQFPIDFWFKGVAKNTGLSLIFCEVHSSNPKTKEEIFAEITKHILLGQFQAIFCNERYEGITVESAKNIGFPKTEEWKYNLFNDAYLPVGH